MPRTGPAARLALALSAAAALAGCSFSYSWIGPGPVAYDGPGTLDDLLAVHRQCHRESAMAAVGGSQSPYAEAAGISARPSCGDLASCMARRGYERKENGRLVIPASEVLPCAGG